MSSNDRQPWLAGGARSDADSPDPQSVLYFRQEKKNIRIAFLLLAAAVLTCTMAGYGWDLEFRRASGFPIDSLAEWPQNPAAMLRGLPYAFALLLILLCHEMGHFLTCRFYRIPCTPPFPLPFPSFFGDFQSFGTLGAFIKIRGHFQNRRQLFDMGVMGPLAGMAAAVPVFILGLRLSNSGTLEQSGDYLVFGDSLLTWFGTSLFFPGGDGQVMVAHPFVWAAFFGFLATSINLLPIGQLDGGHIVYAVFGPKGHRLISRGCFAGLIGVSLLSVRYFSPGYLPFALILYLVLKFRHPPTLDDETKIGNRRLAVALIALLVFVLTFIPVPVHLETF